MRPTIKAGVERFVADYRVKGVRKLVWRSTLAAARALASDAVDKIVAGQTEVLELTSADALVYLRGRDTLARIDVPLDHAAAEYLKAVTLLAGRVSILEACRAWLKRHNVAVPKKTVPEACYDCLAMAKADGKSKAEGSTQWNLRRLQAGQ